MTPEEKRRRDDETRAAARSHGLRERVFVVSGPHSIHGKAPGETVTLELTDDQADALIEAGHITEKSATREFAKGGLIVSEPGPELVEFKPAPNPTPVRRK